MISLIALWIIYASCGTLSAPKPFQHVSLELISDVETIQPGKTFRLGVRFNLEKHWHLYWQNPGDAGMAPMIQWVLPEGFTVTDIQWPVPQRIVEKNIATYIYSKQVLLQVIVTPPKTFQTNTKFTFSAAVDWLLCNQICVAGHGNLKLELQGDLLEKRSSRWSALFDQNQANVPVDLPARWHVDAKYSKTHLELTVISDGYDLLTFYPITQSLILNTAPNRLKPINLHRQGKNVQAFQLSLPLDPLRIDIPEHLTGVMTARRTHSRGSEKEALRVFSVSVLLEADISFQEETYETE